jgi:ribosome-associated protein
MTLHFDVAGSEWLSAAQKRRIAQRLATRMTREGVLRVVCGKHRSQAANRAEAVERFSELLRDALKPRKRRRVTRVPQAERRRRLEQKRRRAQIKRRRGKPDADGD